MKDVQYYELFGGIALKNHTFVIRLHFDKLVSDCSPQTHGNLTETMTVIVTT